MTPLMDKTIELVMSPKKSGAYLSKPDLGKIATVVGFSILLQERKKMATELFKSVRTKEEIATLYDTLVAFYDAKKIDFESVFNFFPSSQIALDATYSKCIDTILKLKEFKEEAELLTLNEFNI